MSKENYNYIKRARELMECYDHETMAFALAHLMAFRSVHEPLALTVLDFYSEVNIDEAIENYPSGQNVPYNQQIGKG